MMVSIKTDRVLKEVRRELRDFIDIVRYYKGTKCKGKLLLLYMTYLSIMAETKQNEMYDLTDETVTKILHNFDVNEIQIYRKELKDMGVCYFKEGKFFVI